jgi:hypothetical protein
VQRFRTTRISSVDEITRPPRKEDLVKLCEELNRLGARIDLQYLLQINDQDDLG